jgi:hypothetical protein
MLPFRVSRPLEKVACHVPGTEAGTVGQVTLAVRVALLPFTDQVRSQPLAGWVTMVPEALPAAMEIGPFSPSVCDPEEPAQVSVWATEAFQLPIQGVVLALPLPQPRSASGATQKSRVLIAKVTSPPGTLRAPGTGGILS